jgi:hypothetical protein
MSVRTKTRVDKIFEMLDDDIDLRSLLRYLVPAFFGNLPDCRGHPWGIKVARFWWSLAPRNHHCDSQVRKFRKRHLSRHKLETETVGTWTIYNLEHGHTSTMTIDKEYISDFSVGFRFSALATPLTSRSSGAQ